MKTQFLAMIVIGAAAALVGCNSGNSGQALAACPVGATGSQTGVAPAGTPCGQVAAQAAAAGPVAVSALPHNGNVLAQGYTGTQNDGSVPNTATLPAKKATEVREASNTSDAASEAPAEVYETDMLTIPGYVPPSRQPSSAVSYNEAYGSGVGSGGADAPSQGAINERGGN